MRWIALLAVFALADLAFASPPMGQLRFRDYAVTVSAQQGHTVYAVYNLTGELLGSGLSLDDVRAQHPDLHGRLADAVAGFAWAGNETTNVDELGFPHGLKPFEKRD